MLAALALYLQYIALYLGVVLLGGSIVHMPADPARYTILALIGIGIFLAASFNEVRLKRKNEPEFSAVRYLIISFFMSIGLGMMSGSIQHFLDTPLYSTKLLTIGLFLSAITYYIREHTEKFSKIALQYTLTIVVVTACIGGGLYSYATALEADRTQQAAKETAAIIAQEAAYKAQLRQQIEAELKNIPVAPNTVTAPIKKPQKASDGHNHTH